MRSGYRPTWFLLILLLLPWASAVSAPSEPITSIEAEVKIADGYVASGELREARAALERIQAQLQPMTAAGTRALVLARLGSVLGQIGEDEHATDLLDQAIALADTTADDGLKASALNDLGNVQLRADPVSFLVSFTTSAALAQQ